jgi:hypothetical protein
VVGAREKGEGVIVRAFFLAAALSIVCLPAFADDYVGRAQSTCAPLKDRPGYDKCVSAAAKDICGGLQSPHDRLDCHQDFERYYSAQVQSLENQRKEAAENTQRLIEQLQRQPK